MVQLDMLAAALDDELAAAELRCRDLEVRLLATDDALCDTRGALRDARDALRDARDALRDTLRDTAATRAALETRVLDLEAQISAMREHIAALSKSKFLRAGVALGRVRSSAGDVLGLRRR